MLLFLRDFWIEKTIYKQVYNTEHWKEEQQMSFHGQLTRIGRELKDGSFEVCVSDSRHFIGGVLAKESIEMFRREIACGIEDIQGCYITVDRFHYEYSFESKKFFLRIEKFTYCGGECDTYGDPADINEVHFLKTLSNSPLYMRPVCEELVIHRASIEDMCEGKEGAYLMEVLRQNNDICGDECRLCSGLKKGDSQESYRPQKQKARRYNPFMERPEEDMDIEARRKEMKKIYLSDGVYVEKKADERDVSGPKNRYLDLCSDSEGEEHKDLL
ncbi:uncharacterized protein Eint_111300 [Encephalitozoon intestinalis ATCC 50506]|uniref:Uncharacterized protein n=1 Tax=Encephalitozoon intestinalis (strain ATCC 50506) TaxID=876142 RepID=E0SA07_ENCIT|nr:uncharacterized protein Eint_111300 [Encephalitozoon intestinalis ATCC 50506]ADM12629.1 hypothetical protein Eint_111300 [Encephalitozoon intestinalis ATCC 50506]UTX46488.1 hypothetical protein GPK93_11g20990 [Encephalitozoon intestinalis]